MSLVSVVIGLRNICQQTHRSSTLLSAPSLQLFCQKRNVGKPVILPELGKGKQYRRKVIFPEDGKYTTEPLKVIKMGGRDPVSGRAVTSKIGGGIKYTYEWVDSFRCCQPDGKPLKEKVMYITENKMVRTAKIALVASSDKKRWIIATENMKVGDIITTYSDLPRIPVRPKEGDSHPAGALPIGTLICNVPCFLNHGGYYAKAAGTAVQILRKVNNRVIIQLPSKHEVSIDEKIIVSVGRVSNVDHSSIPIGSPNANRWLGNRPGSGLWHRKTGYHGRKIRPLPKLKIMEEKETIKDIYCQLTSL